MLAKLVIIAIGIFINTKGLAMSNMTKHMSKVANYSNEAVEAYYSSIDWPDLRLFVQPYVMPELKNLNNKTVLDAGCGHGFYSLIAAANGGSVYGIDINHKMIDEAKNRAQILGFKDINFDIGNVASLPYKNEMFDLSISINLACNLPSNIFNKHFKELFRTLKKGGKAIIVIPTSLNVVFTDGTCNDAEINKRIYTVINSLDSNASTSQIIEALMRLKEIRSATFVKEDKNINLVEDTIGIREGQPIWRKLHNVVVPNFFHGETNYLNALKANHFHIVKILKPTFIDVPKEYKNNLHSPLQFKLCNKYNYYPPYLLIFVKK